MDLSFPTRHNSGELCLSSPIPQLNRSRHYRGLISSAHHGNSNHGNMTSSVASSDAMQAPSRSVERFSNSSRHQGMEMLSYDSGIGTAKIIPERGRSPARGGNPGISQIPVRQTSMKGSQEGQLFPKYFIDASSKCIMCKACGIFFSHDIFLRHLHDAYGKRVECYGQCLELAGDVPSKEQILAFQEFLTKLSRCQEFPQDRVEYPQQITGSSPALRNAASNFLESPSRNAISKSPSKLNSAPVSTWTQDIQETVLASEKLLKETSDYLKMSAKKMQHRRRNSITLKELPFLTKDNKTSNMSYPVVDKPNETVPVIKNQTRHRSSKKSLQNLFVSSDQSSKNEVAKSTLRMSSKPKSDLARPVVAVKSNQVTATSGNGYVVSFSDSSHDPAAARHLTDSLQVEQDLNPRSAGFTISRHLADSVVQVAQDLEPRPSGGSGDAPLCYDVDADGEVDVGKMTADELVTSRRREVPTLSEDKKNDPVYILHTAQDLITLATQRVQHQLSKHDTPDNDWYSRYQAEHILRLKCEASIAELQGLLAKEQKQKQDLEIQLNAFRLQRP